MFDEDLAQVLVRAFTDYLKSAMPSIVEARTEWPEATEKLKYPCLTVFGKTPIYTPLSPYTIWRGEINPTTRKAPYRRVTGEYDFALQVDIWVSYKVQRGKILKEFTDAMSRNPVVAGLSLQLKHYFDEWVRFDIDRFELLGGEEQSQRKEWRVTATVLANGKTVKEYSDHLMETIENNLTTPDEIVADDEDVSPTIL